MQSFNDRAKQRAISNLIRQEVADLVLLIETFLTQKLAHSTDGIKYAQSKPIQRQGVAILCGKRVDSIQEILPHLWTKQLTATKISF